MKLPTDKGYFVWQIPRIGSPVEIATQARAIGLSHVFIKIADGTADYGIVNGHDQAKELVDELKKLLIDAWGWQYVYNFSPILEANKAIQRIRETGVIGFVINAEGECKNKPAEAHLYCQTLREVMGAYFPIGLSSYRFPSVHPEIPWDIFRQYCDFDMPQVYWKDAHNPGAQLIRSLAEFKGMTRNLPYIATGSAYKSENTPWMPSLNEILEFMTTAKGLGLAFNFWEWYDARVILPREIWDAIAAWEIVPPEPPQLPDKIRTTAGSLNLRATPMGTILGHVPKGTLFWVINQANDNNGDKWWKVGEAYLASWWTEAITT